jgi:hypothetical protein
MEPFPSGRKKTLSFALRWAFVSALMAAGGAFMMRMPGESHSGAIPPLTGDETALAERLQTDVVMLAGEIGERNTLHYSALQTAAVFIADRFRGLGLPVLEETYRAGEREVSNIVAEIRGSVHPNEIIVIGAHYDSVAGSPGANDNASGVAALLQLARHYRDVKPQRTIRLVAFVNEEPPYYRTELMGSMVHAQQARKRGEKLVAMLSLETIGCFSDLPKSQKYPAPFSLFYPDTGNFVAFVANFASRDLLHRTIGTFRKTTPFPCEGLAAPEFITGIGWSDHWSFWQAGYPALMVTDTAPFRYPHYHEPTDTPDKLDYGRMARVVTGIGRVVDNLLNSR